jgi:hypothetical protein
VSHSESTLSRFSQVGKKIIKKKQINKKGCRVSEAPEQGCQIVLDAVYKNEKNVPNEYKMYQMVLKYPKCM